MTIIERKYLSSDDRRNKVFTVLEISLILIGMRWYRVLIETTNDSDDHCISKPNRKHIFVNSIVY